MRTAVLVAALIAGFCSIPAAAIPVMCSSYQVGDIVFSGYDVCYGSITEESTHSGDRLDSDIWGGAHLGAWFDFSSCPPGMRLREGAQFRWIQIVWTFDPIPDPVRGLPTRGGYVDPWSNPDAPPYGYEDMKPFYWTDGQWAGQWNADSKTLFFEDLPRRSFSYAPVDWEADLNLVCTWDNMIHVLGYVSWGWEMNAAGDVQLAPAELAWHTGESPALASIVNDPTEFNGAWTFTTECCCVTPDLGATAPLLLLGLTAILSVRKRFAA